MAGTSLFALLDDLATMLDDVAIMTKIATKKTAGVLGDDLALNAEQVAGVSAERELAVVWAVFKGSLLNKVVLVPVALILSQFLPQAIKPLLMLGGAFLCFEGVEKIVGRLFHSKQEVAKKGHELKAAFANPAVDLVALEKDKIKGAIRTDFILSAEIIVISLGAMEAASFGTRIGSLVAVALLVSVGVYGLVAGIVKLDDAGIALSRHGGAAAVLGRFVLWGAPLLMKFLSLAGTVAMFLVGGGILLHGLAPLHHLVEALTKSAGGAGWVVSTVADGLTGLVAGALIAAVVTPITKLMKKKPA
jgi:predicted DNA repair protein MutK